MISLKAFSELLEVLYAAPLHPEQWERFLSLLCEHTRSKSGFLICADSVLGTSIRAQGGGMVLDAAATAAYQDVYAPQDPYRLPMLRAGKTGVVDCEALVPTEELLQTDMYRMVIEPAGLRHPTLMVLTCTVRRLEGISFWRTAEEGPLPAEASRLLDLLVPHIQAALEIRQVLGVAQQRSAGAEAMADASSTATFLLSATGEIRHCNQAAKALLQEADGLVEVDGTLRAAHLKARNALRDLIKNAATARFPPTGNFAMRALSLERTSGARPLQLLASPVPNADAGDLLLLVTDPEKPISLRDDLMRDHYNFTPAETEIANGLLTGYSLDEIAALRRVAAGTVRHQLKTMFRKTATSRQSDLIRLLLNLPQPSYEHA